MSRHHQGVLEISLRHPRMFAAMRHALVMVSGQPDSMATPINETHGRLDVDTHERWKGCSGGCEQGRSACDCTEFRWRDARTGYVLHPELHRITLTEIDNDVAPDASRTFSGKTRDEERAERERNIERVEQGAMAIFRSIVGLAVLAFLASLLMHNN